eukprot:Opistho-2@60480
MDKPQIITHLQQTLPFTLYDAKWIPSSARFVVLGSHARGTGALQVYEMAQGKMNKIAETEKASAFKCGTFGASSIQQRHLATGDFDGRLMTWDLERLEMPIYTARGHSAIINAIDGIGGQSVGCGAPEIATGSRDGSVKVWDVRQKDKPVANMEPAEGDARRDCWTVAFRNSYNDNERCICAGYDNGDIKMFDLRTMSLRWETNVKSGVVSLEFDRRDIEMNKLIATTLDSKFFVFDLRTQHHEKGFASLSDSAHNSTIWCGRHLPQNRDVFLTTGGSGSLSLWKYSYPEQRSLKDEKGHAYGVAGTVSMLNSVTVATQPVASFDWSPDKEGLAVCTSFDQCVRVMIVTKLNKL